MTPTKWVSEIDEEDHPKLILHHYILYVDFTLQILLYQFYILLNKLSLKCNIIHVPCKVKQIFHECFITCAIC